jgi:type II secretory pathway pseudopilin PulG
MHSVKRHDMTLFELLIVIAILSLMAGVIGVQVNKAFREQRFRAEVSQVTGHLRLAQNIMLIFNANVRLRFWTSDEEDAFKYKLIFDTPLPGHWGEEIQRTHTLKEIHFINYWDPTLTPTSHEAPQEEPPQITPDTPKELTLAFLSGGAKMSRHILWLSTSEKRGMPGILERWICLPGYPKPIELLSKEPDKWCLTRDETFERQLTLHTIEEARGKE